MISLATIRLTDGSNEYDVNTLLTRPGSIIGEWQEISDDGVRRLAVSHLGDVEAAVCAALDTHVPASVAAPEPVTPADDDRPGYRPPIGCISGRRVSVPADEYLSGDVRTKLAVARAADSDRNAKALETILPEPITADGLSVGLGAVWVPSEIYRDWLRSLLPGLDWGLNIERTASGWRVACTNPALASVDSHVRTLRVGSIDLIESAMNNQMPLVVDITGGGPGKLRNEAATLEAQARVQELRQHFDSWVSADDSRSAQLCGIYNARFNRFVERQHAAPEVPGLARIVADKLYSLRPFQLRGVAKILSGGTYDRSAYLVYPPGYGKTDPAIAAAVTLADRGEARRSLFVVPKSAAAQWSARFADLFPSRYGELLSCADRVLGVGTGRKARAEFWRRAVRVSRWPFVVITHEMLADIPLAAAQHSALLSNELSRLRQVLRDTEHGVSAVSKDATRLARRALRAQEAALVAEVEAHGSRLRVAEDADLPSWAALAVDHLVLDEAHFAKSLGVATRMERVAGLPRSESARALDCWARCQVVMRAGGRVTALSGTPLTNTLAEAFVWMRMLQPNLLTRVGLESFDDWASVFCEAYPSVEMDCVGKFRAQTRLRYRNVPELIAMLGECWDFARDESEE